MSRLEAILRDALFTLREFLGGEAVSLDLFAGR